MSVWGKLAGVTAGYLVGGIFGAVVGAVAGHYVLDKNDEDVAFAIALIALSAKMSMADGKISNKEFSAFKEILHDLPENELKNVLKVYNLAREDVAGYDTYAKQISSIFQNNLHVLENVIDALFHIAKADGKITDPEIKYLKKVGNIFGFSNKDFDRIYLSRLGCSSDPYLTLGVSKSTPIKEIKKKWKKLAINHHPDKLISQGVPKDLIQKSTSRLKEINNAWDIIQNQR